MHIDTFEEHSQPTNLHLVKSWMAFSFGILLWLPGIGLSVGENVYLQPLELFIIAWTFLWAIPAQFTPRRMRLNGPILVICCVLLASWVLSTIYSMDQTASLKYLYYYLLCVFPGIILFFYIARNGLLLAKFSSGFIGGAIVSSCIGFLQTVLGRNMIQLVNNKNYSLIYGLNKASGFTPEASILAGLLIIALMIVLVFLSSENIRIYYRKMNIVPYLANKRWLVLTLIILLLGLFCTLSTSVMFVLPIVAYVSYRLIYVRIEVRTHIALALGLIITILVFNHVVWSTRNPVDSMGSVLLRAASMLVALKIGVINWIHGIGLGMTKTVMTVPVRDQMKHWASGEASLPGYEQKDGVDSFILHLFAEQGVLILLLFILILFWIFSLQFQSEDGNTPREMRTLLSVIALSSFIIGSLTAGYRGLFHLWLMFPIAGAIRNSQGSKAR